MRLIDADALRNVFDAMHAIPGGSHFDHLVLLGIKKHIDDTPTIDAVEVVHGRWEDETEIIAGIRFPQTRCTACGKVYWGYRTECYYCPNCGAKMDGGADNV